MNVSLEDRIKLLEQIIENLIERIEILENND